VLEATADLVLSSSAKRVYRCVFNLDHGTDGVFLSATEIGLRLGLGDRYVRQILVKLQALGLLTRQGKGWRCLFPAEAIPSVERPGFTEVKRLADALTTDLMRRGARELEEDFPSDPRNPSSGLDEKSGTPVPEKRNPSSGTSGKSPEPQFRNSASGLAEVPGTGAPRPDDLDFKASGEVPDASGTVAHATSGERHQERRPRLFSGIPDAYLTEDEKAERARALAQRGHA
jgi:hypothetical protein